MKKYYLIGALVIVAGLVYYTGLYTYFVRKDVQEALPSAPAATVSGQPAPSQQVIAAGSFEKIDALHKGSGTAKIIQIGAQRILRLEDFSVTSGPDLYVYLTQTQQPTGEIASLGDYKSLGPLKGTSGNQNYDIPAGLDGYTTAVIWCKRYGVLFTYAVMN